MRTLFFSFSAQTVVKNFFFFDGCFLERFQAELDRDPHLQIVIVMPDTDKYDGLLARFTAHPRLFVAKIPWPKVFSWPQKIVRFFYSYFIYTGTTRIMATIGIRPDEPPAGGRFKKFLGPVKWGISKTFGRSGWMRERVVPALYYRVFRLGAFENLLQHYHPRLVFLPHLYGSFDTALLAAAWRRGIRSVGMISNWDHFDKYYLPFKAEILLAQSEQIKRFALVHQGYRPDQIRLVGYPYFDFIFHEAETKSRPEVLADLHLPPEARYIIYISGSAYCWDEPDIIEEMLEWIENGHWGTNLYLVIRPYAGTRPEDREYDKNKFDRFLDHPRARIFAGEFWGNVMKSSRFVHILRHSDVVCVVYSTAALEAAALHRPLVAPTFDGHAKRPFFQSIRRFEIREHFREVLETGALRPAYNFRELKQYVGEYLEDPQRDADKRRTLLDRLCYRVDGRSSERVMDHILSALYGTH